MGECVHDIYPQEAEVAAEERRGGFLVLNLVLICSFVCPSRRYDIPARSKRGRIDSVSSLLLL